MTALEEYVLRNSKCKVPWMLAELKEVVYYAVEQLALAED